MAERSGLYVTAGEISGSSYVLLTTDVPPKFTTLKYGLSDILVRKMSKDRTNCNIPIDSMVPNQWTEWYKKRAFPTTHWTIMEYKLLFKGKRPDYAKSFREKKGSNQKYDGKKSFLVPEPVRTLDNWFIERERLPNERNQQRTVIVERIFDASGNVRRVTLLFFGMDVLVRQEDKISRHKWSVSVRNEIDIKKSPQQMIDTVDPWAVHIRSVVQY